MPERAPPSLGDGDKSKYRLARLEQMLPTTRREIIQTFQEILKLGGVQKVIFEVGRPIQYYRLMAKDFNDEPLPPDAILAGDLYASMMSAEVVELDGTVDAYQSFFKAFELVTKKDLRPRAILLGDMDVVVAWMKLSPPFELREFFGVQVFGKAELPPNVVMLCASHINDPETIQYSVKICLP